MRRSRVYTSQPMESGLQIELTDSAGHYLSRVLRLTAGDSVILFNGDGSDYAAMIVEIQRQQVSLRITDSKLSENESKLKITLVQAISRGERMDYSLQKATELGVHCIQPISSRRVEVHLDEKRLRKKLEHWQKVVISACEQSGRAVIPEVKTPVSLADWLASADDSLRVVLDPSAQSKLSQLPTTVADISLLVGPEGGFSEEELQDLASEGVMAVSLGPRVLRTESAGPAAIAVLQAIYGDL
jgi:16S rRNA (uracil1498-N3)-methyltransferase